MKQFFKSEAGQKAFGKWHIYGWDAAVLIEAQMVELAKLMSLTGDISLPENFIRSWSDDNPIQTPFFVRESDGTYIIIRYRRKGSECISSCR
jgi:hypothetical protein